MNIQALLDSLESDMQTFIATTSPFETLATLEYLKKRYTKCLADYRFMVKDRQSEQTASCDTLIAHALDIIVEAINTTISQIESISED